MELCPSLCHIDKWSKADEKKHLKASISCISDGINRELYKVFEKYSLGDKAMQIKQIAAFMNSEGGKLIVGVEDNGNILDIEEDFQTFSDRKNWDGWMQHLVNIVRKHIGTEYLEHIIVEALDCDGKTVARIRVQKSYKPAFVEQQDNKGGQTKVEFY
jgi:predicted HTH transcriptional regulator